MLIKQLRLKDSSVERVDKIPFKADLILLFISKKTDDLALLMRGLKVAQPKAVIAGCSTPGVVQ